MQRRANLVLLLVFLLAISIFQLGCFRRDVRSGKSVSELTHDGDVLYFGAGYHLYSLHIPSRSIEKIYTTDRIQVEQPLIADGVAYFGGRSGTNKSGSYGEKQGFFALDLESREVAWKFPLGVGGYGTFGTYPVLAGDGILVAAREHLHSLDRKSGEETWRVDNWMGRDSDRVTFPYVYKDHVYFKIGEENVAGSQKSDQNDGHWAEVSLASGERSIIPIADRPGTYKDSSGNGFGLLVDGVIYGTTRIERFGALDLETKKILWEVEGINRALPAVSDSGVFTTRADQILSLDRKSGKVIWNVPLGELAQTDSDRSRDPWKYEHDKYWSPRFAVSKDILVVQGSKGIVGLTATDGERLWFAKFESEWSNVNPLILQEAVITVSDKDCVMLALDLNTGGEIWRVNIPDCTHYYIVDS